MKQGLVGLGQYPPKGTSLVGNKTEFDSVKPKQHIGVKFSRWV